MPSFPGRALGSHGGGSGILVEDEQARAIRNESATAIKHWWGVSAGAVWRWRKALGVGRADPEGSRRLIQAAAELGADAMRGRGLTDEERDERARRSKDLNLGRYLKTGYHGPLWTPEQIALLGTMPDEELAGQLGKSPNAVRLKRQRLGIRNPHDGRSRESK